MKQSKTMTFNPGKPHRRSIRLQGGDYTQAGAYFVTLCTYQRQCLFGEIVDGSMCLNICGQFVQAYWNNLPSHFQAVKLDTFVVMPNHLHGIIILTEKSDDVGVGAKHSCLDISTPPEILSKNASPLPRLVSSPLPPNGTQSGSLGAIIQNFKSISTRKINRINRPSRVTVWQRNYHEHIIRNEKSLQHIRQYIIENPQRWTTDPENPQNQ